MSEELLGTRHASVIQKELHVDDWLLQLQIDVHRLVVVVRMLHPCARNGGTERIMVRPQLCRTPSNGHVLLPMQGLRRPPNNL